MASLKSVHARHDDVEQDDIRPLFLHDAQAILTIVCGKNVHASSLDAPLNNLDIDRLVVDDEDSRVFHRRRALGGCVRSGIIPDDNRSGYPIVPSLSATVENAKQKTDSKQGKQDTGSHGLETVAYESGSWRRFR